MKLLKIVTLHRHADLYEPENLLRAISMIDHCIFAECALIVDEDLYQTTAYLDKWDDDLISDNAIVVDPLFGHLGGESPSTNDSITNNWAIQGLAELECTDCHGTTEVDQSLKECMSCMEKKYMQNL